MSTALETARAKEKRLVPTTAGPRRLPPRNDLGEFRNAVRSDAPVPGHTSRARPPVPVEHDQWWTEPAQNLRLGPELEKAVERWKITGSFSDWAENWST